MFKIARISKGHENVVDYCCGVSAAITNYFQNNNDIKFDEHLVACQS